MPESAATKDPVTQLQVNRALVWQAVDQVTVDYTAIVFTEGVLA